MGEYDGHRGRLRERFLGTGLDGFHDHEALELLLFYALPRIDTKQLARSLIDRFGSFNAVFDAPAEELKRVKGVGPNAAMLIKLILPLNRHYLLAQNRDVKILNSTEKAGRHLIPLFHAELDEVVYMLCFDAKYKLLSSRRMFRGSVSSANISVRKIVEHALEANAVSVIIAHNHISGTARPSREDQEATSRIASALKAIDITLADHIIVVGDDYISMADLGFMTNAGV